MKRLIFIALVALVGLTAQAQVNKTLLATVKDSVALVADTTNAYGPYLWDYKWVVTVDTYTLSAADATLTIQVSNDSLNWINYADNAALALTNTSGLHGFEDDRMVWQYFRFITAAGTVATGEYTVKLYAVRNR